MIYRFTKLVFGFGSLVSCMAQTCNTTCDQNCGPIQDVGKTMYQKCMGTCLQKCAKCAPVTGTLFPKYYVLGLVYAPPGCTSTSALKCGSQSAADYQAGSSMGTKVSTENSFQKGVDLKVDLSIGDDKAGKFGASASGGYSDTSTDSNSQTITKGETLDIKASGNGDGVDHDQDTFILLLNPAIAVKQNQLFNDGERCVATKEVEWYLGLNSTSATQDRYTLTVAALKNPASMDPNVAQQLQALHFTNADFQTILALDPFANGSTTIDPDRFAPTTYAFPYEPASQSQECNGGVCSCLAMSDSIKNEFATESGSSTKTEYKVGLSESVSGIDLGIFSFGASSSQNFTWTSSSSTSNTTSDTQTASVTVTCPSPNYRGPTLMSIYWDKLFGSFLFVPTVLNSPQTAVLARGTVTSTSGQPLRHQKVELSFGGKTYHTYTDGAGKYVFTSNTALARSGTGQLLVKGVRQTVTLGSMQDVNIRVQ